MAYFEEVAEAAEFLRARLRKLTPRVAVVLGSGLGAVANHVTESIQIPYREIPHFPKSTVEGHSGRMVAGRIGGAPVIVMQGRVHFYEGYSPDKSLSPCACMGALGVARSSSPTRPAVSPIGYKIGQLVAHRRSHQHDGLEPAGRPQ